MSLEDSALIMCNARKIIKAKAKTSNAGLYMQLFGTGHGTAIRKCKELGLDPDSNKTCYTEIMNHLRNLK